MNKIIAIAMVMLLPCWVMAQLPQYQGQYNPQESLQEYFAQTQPHYDRSIIFVFFNNNPCYGCPQAISMLDRIYQQYYAQKYSLLMVDYQSDTEYNFAATYDLSQPLEVVLVRIDDGAAFGYQKIEGLQNQISDKTSFEEYVRYRIDSFLGNNG